MTHICKGNDLCHQAINLIYQFISRPSLSIRQSVYLPVLPSHPAPRALIPNTRQSTGVLAPCTLWAGGRGGGQRGSAPSRGLCDSNWVNGCTRPSPSFPLSPFSPTSVCAPILSPSPPLPLTLLGLCFVLGLFGSLLSSSYSSWVLSLIFSLFLIYTLFLFPCLLVPPPSSPRLYSHFSITLFSSSCLPSSLLPYF